MDGLKVAIRDTKTSQTTAEPPHSTRWTPGAPGRTAGHQLAPPPHVHEARPRHSGADINDSRQHHHTDRAITVTQLSRLPRDHDGS